MAGELDRCVPLEPSATRALLQAVPKISEDTLGRNERHAKIRWAKRILRFVPRRAAFHRYPVIGRFADFARRRAYLWSFKPRYVRPAIYLGGILSLWPVMGLQVAVALAASLLLRANVMVAGALQFVTNPLTAAPLYYLTYHVGKVVLSTVGEKPVPDLPGGSADEVFAATLEAHADLSSGFTQTVAALFVGGTLCGMLMAMVIDGLYLWSLKTGRSRR